MIAIDLMVLMFEGNVEAIEERGECGGGEEEEDQY